MQDKKIIITKEVAAAKLKRMALEIAERDNNDNITLVIIGIKSGGMIIAAQIAELLKHYGVQDLQLVELTIKKTNPEEISLSEQVNFNDKNILLIDDVCNTGKTLLYALKPLLQFHPASIHTLVLVERMHKLFPIKPDYVGLSLATTQNDYIHVDVNEGEITAALIQKD